MSLVRKLLLGGAVLVGGALVARSQATRLSTPEPRYAVVRSLAPSIEVRRYEPMVLAETRVGGSLEEATTEGFRRLAGYIFGGNRRAESIAMTTPVTTASERLAMTTPVTTESAAGEHLVRFVLPPDRALASFPVPNDARVTLREVPARTVAVLRYGGTAGREAIAERTRELEVALEQAGLRPTGAAVSSRYDPPWTLPLFRRNEVWIELDETPGPTSDAS